MLVKHAVYKDALQSIAQEHVLPLFVSPYPFLRAKAAWLAGVFAGVVEFTTGDGSRKQGHGELFDQLFDCVLRCMKDSCGPSSLLLAPHRAHCCSLKTSFSLLRCD